MASLAAGFHTHTSSRVPGHKVAAAADVQTSVGGVPDRSVPHGLRLIDDAFQEGRLWFARSDISSFFDSIPRDTVIASIAEHVEDQPFIDLLTQATTVVLANEHALGDDRSCFPMGEDGVAQGSPLSPLFGNTLLHDFDRCLNGRGIVCVRFIDDFVLLGSSQSTVTKAFASARARLAEIGLSCHDPYASGDRAKSAQGHARNGFDFLGYRIEPGLRQPSSRARKKLLAAVEEQFSIGRRAINKCLRESSSLAHRQRAPQTIEMVDRIVKGWGNAFSYGNAKATLADLDRQIDARTAAFRAWFARRLRALSDEQRRRVSGICQLADIPMKKLDELPFRLSKVRRPFRRLNSTITISTDGSVITGGTRGGREKGPGGWAYVVHEANRVRSGPYADTTNNHMELLAVVTAVRDQPHGSSVILRSDSQYVASTFNSFQVVKANFGLWRELEILVQTRAVKIEWVRGHVGDPHNELADKLAREAACSVMQGRAAPIAA